MDFLCPARLARVETRVLGSRFLAEAGPVADEAAAGERRAALAAELDDATHHCWALRIRIEGGDRERSDDAGEPAGTAGRPILQAIRAADLRQAMVVVVRWFGGTKLGKGGLARAYRDAARAAIAAAGVERVEARRRLRLAGPVAADGEVRHLLARHGGRIVEAGYDETGGAFLGADLPEAAGAAFTEALGRLTRGTWHVEADPAPGPPARTRPRTG